MPHKLNPAKKPQLPAPVPKVPVPRYGLTPWQIAFCSYDVNESRVGGRGPSKDAQVAAATALANKGRDVALPRLIVTYEQIKTLRHRQDYRELFEAMRVGGIEEARALLVNNLPAYVSAHYEALTWAKEKKDVQGVATLASPVLKSVLPQSEARPATVININIPEQRRHLVYQEPAPIEYEVVPRPTPEEPT